MVAQGLRALIGTPYIVRETSLGSRYRCHEMGIDRVLITILLRKDDNARQGSFFWWSWMDSHAEAMAHCNILNDVSTINLTASYAPLQIAYTPTAPSSLPNEYAYVAINNATTHASIWWGARLLNNNFTGLQYIMSGNWTNSTSESSSDSSWAAAGMTFSAGNATSIKDVHLFSLGYYFLKSLGQIKNDLPADISTLYNNYSNAWISQPLPNRRVIFC